MFFGLRRSSVLGFRGLLGVRSFAIKVGFLRFRVFQSFKVVEFFARFFGFTKTGLQGYIDKVIVQQGFLKFRVSEHQGCRVFCKVFEFTRTGLQGLYISTKFFDFKEEEGRYLFFWRFVFKSK